MLWFNLPENISNLFIFRVSLWISSLQVGMNKDRDAAYLNLKRQLKKAVKNCGCYSNTHFRASPIKLNGLYVLADVPKIVLYKAWILCTSPLDQQNQNTWRYNTNNQKVQIIWIPVYNFLDGLRNLSFFLFKGSMEFTQQSASSFPQFSNSISVLDLIKKKHGRKIYWGKLFIYLSPFIYL